LGHSNNIKVRVGLGENQRIRHNNGGDDDNKQAVFVGAVEIVENQKSRCLDRAACAIWLQVLDNLSCIGRNPMYFSTFTGSFKALRCATDRELQHIVLSAAGTDAGELGDKMIERGTEVVKNLSNENRESWGNFTLSECREHILSRLSIEMTLDSIVVTKKAGNFQIQIVDALVGPI